MPVCIEPLIDPAGFRRGMSTVDQVNLLTEKIEDAFEAKQKLMLYLSIRQLLMTLSGTVVLLPRC